MITHQQIVDFLKNCKYICNVSPVTVKIKDESWFGAVYQDVAEVNKVYPKGKDERIYCVGMLPKIYIKDQRICFPASGYDQREWYIAGYCPSIVNNKQNITIREEFQSFHPFGPNFVIKPWVTEHSIDCGEKHPYKRISMIVQVV